MRTDRPDGDVGSVAGAWAAVFCPSAVVWGDVATWATALFTLLATIGAAFAAYQAWKVLGLERGRDERADEDRRRAQAEQVSACLDRAAYEADPSDQKPNALFGREDWDCCC